LPEIGETRVLSVSHYFATNGFGVELIASRINELLRSRGFHVRWLATTACNSVTNSLPSGPDEVGIRSWDGIREATDLAFPLFPPWRASSIVREVRKADVVHLHEAFYPLHQVALWSAVVLGRPVMITQHIADMPVAGVLRGNAVRLANLVMTRPAFAVADRVVFYSRRTQEHFRDLASGKDVFIWNGCDAELFHPGTGDEAVSLRAELGLSSGATLALFVGRFIEKKGLRRLRELAAVNPEVHFLFIGAGPMDPGSWGLPNVLVRATTPQHELARFYQGSDVLLLPAVGEGLPLVLQEASCCGLPSIVSREVLDACPELEPFTIDAGPAGKYLAESFAAFLGAGEPPERAVERAGLARELWSWERCGDEYARVVHSIVRPADARRFPLRSRR
jgi:glycosyltransferase involved in cell wall biosynthesis